MLLFKVLFCILVLYYGETVFAVLQSECLSCVSIKSCEPALNIMRNIANISPADNYTLRTSFCGYHNDTAKVCCSNFNDTKENPHFTTRITNVAETPVVQSPRDYDTHPNARLLPEMCGEIDGLRIVGGEVAKLYEFPWIAVIAYNTANGLSFNCAGSVINSRYILTAAHCVIRNGVYMNIAYVRIGEWDFDTATDCQGDYINMICESKLQNIPVEDKIVHQKFNNALEPHDDIALLRLQHDIDLTYNNAQPICLPLYRNLQNVNLGTKTAVVAGWGQTKSKDKSNVLRKVEIPILSADVCSSYLGRDYLDLMSTTFCAGAINKDSCKGDSGGPLMLEDEYDDSFRLIQYGIVSFGPTKCGTNVPGVYTDVTKYMGWILDNIKN